MLTNTFTKGIRDKTNHNKLHPPSSIKDNN